MDDTRPPADSDEATLLRAARRGDQDAFAALYRLHAKAIHSLVLRLSGTGTEGATLRVYLERYAGTDQPHDLDPETALAPVIAAAEELALIREHTGRDRPDVTT